MSRTRARREIDLSLVLWHRVLSLYDQSGAASRNPSPVQFGDETWDFVPAKTTRVGSTPHALRDASRPRKERGVQPESSRLLVEQSE